MDSKIDAEMKKKFDEWMAKAHPQILWYISNINEEILKDKLYGETDIFESLKEGFETGFESGFEAGLKASKDANSEGCIK